MGRCRCLISALALTWLATASGSAWAQNGYTLFESGPVRPLALSPDGTKLFACNIPDDRLEIFDVTSGSPKLIGSVQVGLEPVAVAARSNAEVWVVNHLSDSISIVDVATQRVTRTLLVGDEPRDIVFGGSGKNRAFITAAHRGQNRPGDPQLLVSGVGRSDVWVFDATSLGAALGGTPLAVLNLFGDTPRALAVTPTGDKVYAAVFHSGNQTTALPNGFLPQLTDPNNSLSLPLNVPAGEGGPTGNLARPNVGVMLKYQSGTTWMDPQGHSFNNVVNFLLPDHDVFAIDANANPPAQSGVYDHVGTILYNMVVNPDPNNPVVYVSNTDSNNMDRFEGFGPTNLRGELHKARISILSGTSTVTIRHLNKHIDYAPDVAPTAVNAASLGIPTEMAITSDGSTLYLAAFGSQEIGDLRHRRARREHLHAERVEPRPALGGGPRGRRARRGAQPPLRVYALRRRHLRRRSDREARDRAPDRAQPRARGDHERPALPVRHAPDVLQWRGVVRGVPRVRRLRLGGMGPRRSPATRRGSELRRRPEQQPVRANHRHSRPRLAAPRRRQPGAPTSTSTRSRAR